MTDTVIRVWHDENGQTLGVYATHDLADSAIDDQERSYNWRKTEHDVITDE